MVFVKSSISPFSPGVERKDPLLVDCANGVGAVSMHQLLAHSNSAVAEILNVQLRNVTVALCHTYAHSCGRERTRTATTTSTSAATGHLNHLCGADHLQKAKYTPFFLCYCVLSVRALQGCPRPVCADELMKKSASLDGDADRLVYFFVDHSVSVIYRLFPRVVCCAAKRMIWCHAVKGAFRLLDGDKIISLYSLFILELIKVRNQ